jgi:hypothetical protein
MEQLGKDAVTFANQLAKTAGKAIGDTLVDTTRVDTGEARSNWRASLNVALSGKIPAYAPGNKLGIGERANASAAKAQHAVVVKQFNTTKGNGAMFWANSVPHIGFLNDGTPKITPGNMVAKALLAGKVALKGIKLRL